MKALERLWADFLSHVIELTSKTIGMISDPFVTKCTSYKNILDILPILEEGDVILTRTYGHASTLIIPGFWKHATIYVGRDVVGTPLVKGEPAIIEAVAPKVRYAYLNDLIQKTDYFCVLRLKNINKEQRKNVALEAMKFIDKKYDFRQCLNKEDRVSCSELVFHAVNNVLAGGHHYLVPVEKLGYLTYPPDQIRHDEHWMVLYEKNTD